jgi:hypothetical protein
VPYTTERLRSRHPFEVFMLGASAIFGVGGLVFRQAQPNSIQGAVGHSGTALWGMALLLGSLGALAGIAWRDRATGLTMEAIGCCTVGISTIFYGAAGLILLGGTAAYSAAVMFGFGAAGVWRFFQIRRLLRRVANDSKRR